jgi:hypothetical protein
VKKKVFLRLLAEKWLAGPPPDDMESAETFLRVQTLKNAFLFRKGKF